MRSRLLLSVLAVLLFGCSSSIRASSPVPSTVALADHQRWNLTFSPASIRNLTDGDELWVNLTLVLPVNAFASSCELLAFVKDSRIAKIVHVNNTKIREKDTVFETPMLIKGTRLGETFIEFKIQYPNGTTESILQTYEVIVLRRFSIHSIIFRVITTTLVVVITLLMGCDLNPQIIFSYLKKPVAPAIGFASQFIIMPLSGFALAYAMDISKNFGLGLLTIACSPGGGGSNMWTILLHGELNLSITMTFISTVSAMGMMPLWLFLLGRFFIDVSKVVIPYHMIAINLLQVVLPCAIGLFIRWKWEKVALKLRKGIRPMALVFIFYIITYGTYANLYMYQLMGDYPIVIVSGALLPWVGFTLGGLLALLARQKRAKCITIALETGIQNIGIAIIILLYSMPQPMGDLAGVLPVVVAVFTPIPLYLTLMGLGIRRCIVGRRSHNLPHDNNEEEQKPSIASPKANEKEAPMQEEKV